MSAQTDISMEELQGMVARKVGANVNKEKRVVKFEFHPVEDRTTPGVRKYQDVVYIRSWVPGDKTVLHRKATKQDIANYPEQYMVFKQLHEEEKTEGFPVSKWGICTRAEAKTLIENGVKTLELLVEVDDKEIMKLGQEYVDLKTAAEAHFKAENKTVELKKLIAQAKKDAETIKTLKSKVSILESKIEELKDGG